MLVTPIVRYPQAGFLAALSADELDDLERIGMPRDFPRGTLLMFDREPAERAMILLAGRVKVSRGNGGGQEVLLSIQDPGDVLGELGCIDGQPRAATVTALEPVQALVIPGREFRHYLENRPRAAMALLITVATRLRETTAKRSEFGSSDTMGRVSARLLELAERYGEPQEQGVMITMPISQDELGMWAGASRAGVTRALQQMRELGWIRTERRRVLLRNAAYLRARAA